MPVGRTMLGRGSRATGSGAPSPALYAQRPYRPTATAPCPSTWQNPGLFGDLTVEAGDVAPDPARRPQDEGARAPILAFSHAGGVP